MAVDNGDVLEYVIRYAFPGAIPCVNAFRLQYRSSSSISDSQALTDIKALTDYVYGQLDDILCSSVYILNPLVNEVYPYPHYLGLTTTTARYGVRSALPLPVGACAAVTAYAGLPRKRGTYRFSGVPYDHHSAGSWSSTFMTELTQLAAALISGWSFSSPTREYWRVFFNWRDNSVTDITTSVARSTVFYYRKRRPR